MGSSSAASTACGLPPAPSPTSPRDHLDYHPSFEAYFNEKLRLFAELLPQGAGAVIDVDSKAGEQVAALAQSRGLSVMSVGRAGKALRLISAERDGFGQRLVVEHAGGTETFRLPLRRRLPGLERACRRGPVHGHRSEPHKVVATA